MIIMFCVMADVKSSFLSLREKMTMRILHVSELDSIFILIGAWQVAENGDGFEVIYWKFLTGAVEENVKPRTGIHGSKIICQDLAYLRRRLPVIFHVRLTVHQGGFDQELCCTPDVKHIHQVDIRMTKKPGKQRLFLMRGSLSQTYS